jgi:undecaprenyl-diphosphatase
MTTPLTVSGAVRDEAQHRPIVALGKVAGIAYVVLTPFFVALGLLTVHVLAHGGIGHWDVSVNRWFAHHRTHGWNSATSLGSQIASTQTVIAIAALAVLILAIKHCWRDAALLLTGLVLEVSVFVTTTLFVDRHRPPVPKLDAAPPTSSFPSGHTGAAVVLYTTLAIIVTMRLRQRILSAVLWVIAALTPVAVAFSRLYRGMHHPTDVIAGALLGLACLYVAHRAVAEAYPEEETP